MFEPLEKLKAGDFKTSHDKQAYVSLKHNYLIRLVYSKQQKEQNIRKSSNLEKPSSCDQARTTSHFVAIVVCLDFLCKYRLCLQGSGNSLWPYLFYDCKLDHETEKLVFLFFCSCLLWGQ